MSFLRHTGIYRSDMVNKTFTTWGGVPPPAGRPRPQSKDATEELRALLIVRDEFPGWLFLGGLLSSRARLRFTNRLQYRLGDTCW